MKLFDEARLDWLQMIRTESIGPVRFHRLIERFGDAKSAVAALPRLARDAGRAAPVAPASRDAARNEIENARAIGATLVAA